MTIVHCKGKRNPQKEGSLERAVIRAGGLVRITGGTRSDIFPVLTATAEQPKGIGWTNAPTPETAGLLEAMKRRKPPDTAEYPQGSENHVLTYPPSAAYFLTIIPPGLLPNERRKTVQTSGFRRTRRAAQRMGGSVQQHAVPCILADGRRRPSM